MGVSNYNSDPNANTSISGINIAEGCPPSGINNAIRQIMADVKVADGGYVKTTGNQSISGAKTFSNGIVASYEALRRPDNTTGMWLFGGNTTDADAGAKLVLYGGSNASAANQGNFMMQAGKPGAYTQLIGTPGGLLTWGGNVALNADSPRLFVNTTSSGTAAEIHLQTSGVADGGIALNAGKDVLVAAKSGNTYWYQGACLTLKVDGSFDLRAKNSSVNKSLVGTPAGALTWGGKGFVFTSGDQTVEGLKEFPSKGDGIRVSHDSTLKCSFLRGETYVGVYDSVNSQWIVRVAPNKSYVHYGTLQAVSDKRLKKDITEAPDSLLDAWDGVKWQQYKYNGVSDNLLHVGLVAQDVESGLEGAGIKATDYGFLLHEKAEAEEGQEPVEQYYVNYADALSVEAAYQRRRADRAEARIATLERRLDELEAALAALGA